MLSLRHIQATVAFGALGFAFAACGDAQVGGEDVGSQGSAITPISGCDYSFARPSPASLVSMGYHFAARYLSGDPGGGKDITASEANALTAAGLDVVLVWETTGTDAQNGYNAGVSDAQAAKSEAVSVGQPSTRPIYFALDWDETSAEAGAVDEYFKGVASVLGLSRTGAYGGYYAVDQLFNSGLITYGWQTYAWSGGAWDSRAQLRQTQNGVDGDQLDDDLGMVADYGQWGPGAPSGTFDYAAAYVSQSFPLAVTALDMVEGQTIPSYIELKNTGTKTWDSNTRIGTTQPRDRSSDFADSSWIAPNRPAAVTGTVPPGGTFKFQFNLHAPSTTGTYHEYFGVVQEGVAWFSDPGQGGPPDNDLEVRDRRERPRVPRHVRLADLPARAGRVHDARRRGVERVDHAHEQRNEAVDRGDDEARADPARPGVDVRDVHVALADACLDGAGGRAAGPEGDVPARARGDEGGRLRGRARPRRGVGHLVRGRAARRWTVGRVPSRPRDGGRRCGRRSAGRRRGRRARRGRHRD